MCSKLLYGCIIHYYIIYDNRHSKNNVVFESSIVDKLRDTVLINSYNGDPYDYILQKMLNDSIKKISETNSPLDMLCEFEKVIDDADVYAYKNWDKGEILSQ